MSIKNRGGHHCVQKKKKFTERDSTARKLLADRLAIAAHQSWLRL